ncbi:DUF4145 domain-containing protein [Pseudochrobactrum sp. XF203]|uniref:DUF4145 domain-containing protein n=1 Tax=Pseudochrobactrum sp. XF203 TaxID=2879116 RepID=UPI001CE26879|nr:DUF4145 domain-containing protein [Pseudochrobactrum sp. XF203]UCA46163.1 DUF4145 domain-containing protein [Pseudochrobactrum sp. XF203]
MTTVNRIGTKRKAFCANCKGDRHCEIKGHHRESESDHHMYWWTDWYLLVCCGCDHIFAESVSSDSESHYQVGISPDGEPEYEHHEEIRSWPARFKRDRPSWLEGLHKSIKHNKSHDFQSCLLQVYEALDHDLNILAGIGTRTVFDIATEILGIDSELPFIEKLNEMVAKNLITSSQKDHLEVVIDAGGASAHRGWLPHVEDLNTLMDILESFIHDSFVLPAKKKATDESVAKVKGKVPPRKSRSGTKKSLATPKTPA